MQFVDRLLLYPPHPSCFCKELKMFEKDLVAVLLISFGSICSISLNKKFVALDCGRKVWDKNLCTPI